MKRAVLVVMIVCAFSGCTEKPPTDADGAQEPDATTTDAVAEEAPATVADDAPRTARVQREVRRSEPGIRLEGALVTITARSLGEVFDAILGTAEAVRPGTGVLGRMAVFGGMGVPPDLMTRLGKDRPLRVFVLHPAKGLGTAVCVVGDAGADSLDYLSGIITPKLGLQPVRNGNSLTYELVDDRIHIVHASPWLVIGDEPEGVKAVVGQLAAGAEPTLPDGEDHIAVELDMGELENAYGEEISESLGMLKGVANTMEQQTPIAPRIIDEYVNAIEAAFDVVDTVEISLAFTRTSVDARSRIVPLAGSALAPIGRSTTRCAWKVARALPRSSMMTFVTRPDAKAAGPMLDAIAGALARVCGSEDPTPEERAMYRGFMETYFQIGENAFSLNIDEGMQVIMCLEADMLKMRSMYQTILPQVNKAFGSLFETIGLEIAYEYKQDVRQIAGKPVDSVDTTYSATTDEGRKQLALMQQMWGQSKQTLDITQCSAGTLGVMSSDNTAFLADAMKVVDGAGKVDRFGWPSASDALRDALQDAPDATWMAGELRIGAYMAFAFSTAAQSNPMIAMMFPDTSALGVVENDPPVVFWAGSDDGDILGFERVPTPAIANLVKFFESASAKMQGDGPAIMPMPDEGNGDGDGGNEADLF